MGLKTKIESIPGAIDKVPRPVIAALGVVLAFLIGVLDLVTGYEINLSFFYLLPVLLLSWRFEGSVPVVLISVLCVFIQFMADIMAGHVYSSILIPFWNGVMMFGILLSIAYSFAALKKVLRRESGFARIDYLTEVSNARHFYELASVEAARSARYRRPLSIAVMDVDNFKYVNDNFGHPVGDQLLQTVAKTVQKTLRKTDTIARMGGDEFAFLLPETKSSAAVVAINKVRDNLLAAMEKKGWPVTFSIGVVSCNGGHHLDVLMKMADDLMYTAKKSGKNMIWPGDCP